MSASITGSLREDPILLVEQCNVPGPTAAFHVANADTLTAIIAVGGTAAVCDANVTAAIGAATAIAPEFTSATLAVEALTAAEIVVADVAAGPDGALGTSDDVITENFTLTAKEDGAAASAYDFVIADPDPANPVDVTLDGTTITLTVPGFPADNDLIVAAFEASDANDLFTITATADDLATGAAVTSIAGTSEVTVVATANRALTAPADGTPGLVYSRPGPAGTEVIELTADLDVDGLFVTYTGTASTAAAIPVLGNDELRVTQDLVAAGVGLTTADEQIVTLTSAP